MTMKNELGLKVQSCAFARVPKFGKNTKVWQNTKVRQHHQSLAKSPNFGKCTIVWQMYQILAKTPNKLLGKVPDYHWLVKIKKII
jgi:hypothetical protein